MTKSTVSATELATDMLEGIEAVMDIDATETKPKATPKPKAKTKPKVKPTPKPKTKAKAEPKAKPEPVTIGGFTLKPDADVRKVQAGTDTAKTAIEAISNKDADLLQSYLALGEFQSTVSVMFASTKVYGQYLAEAIPASQTLDPALRSNCKWLYEALNVLDHKNNDLLKVLDVNRIEDYKSANPTVIKRNYSQAVKTQEAVAKADKLGIEADTDEEKVSAVAAKEKKANEAKTSRRIKKGLKRAQELAMQHKDNEGSTEELLVILERALIAGTSEALEYIESL